MNSRIRRAGAPPDRLRSRLGSGERLGVRESIYESGIEEKPIRRPSFPVTASAAADALQFLEGVAEVVKDIARQQRLLALIAVENCDLRCATA